MSKPPKLAEIAKRIDDHLNRLEAAGTKTRDGQRSLFYCSGACAAGSYVSITYISYQGSRCISKSDAVRYLAALDSGSKQRHYEALRDAS